MTDNGIYKYLDCSTSHITHDDDMFLDLPNDVIVEKFQFTRCSYGYWIHVPETKEDIEQLEISDSLKEVIHFALKKKCVWIKLDCDGFIHPKLKTYRW